VEVDELRRPRGSGRAVRRRIEQAAEFREEVGRYTDAERVILADGYQTCCTTAGSPSLLAPGDPPIPGPRAGDA
jgi:hypothetical protein